MLKIKVQWYLQYQIQSNKQLGTENFNKLKSSGKEKGLQIFFFPEIILFCLNVASTLLLVHYLQISAYKNKTNQS